MYFLFHRVVLSEREESRKNKKWYQNLNTSKISDVPKCPISVQFPKSKWDSEDEDGNAETNAKSKEDDTLEEGEIETEIEEDKPDTPERLVDETKGTFFEQKLEFITK